MAYRVLIIGCGAIAGGYDAARSPDDWPLSHAGAIARDDRFELAACVDPDDAVRKAFAERWNVPVAAPSYSALDAEPGEFDVIVIASPTQFHADHLEEAHRLQPKLVFCEKPIADRFSHVLEITNRLDGDGILLAVNHTRRWAPDLIELATQSCKGEWGRFVNAVGTYGKGVVHNGSHMVDLLRMFLGDLEVHSVGPAIRDHWEHDPSVSALLTSGGGACVHLVASDSRALTQFELVLTFEHGEIAMRDGGMRIETRRVIENDMFPGYRTLGHTESETGRYPEAMTCAYGNIADALENGAALASTGKTAFSAHAICEQIRRMALENLEKGPE